MQFVLFVFFFQAEDGIRDLVRSRGLGDVYKRQIHGFSLDYGATASPAERCDQLVTARMAVANVARATTVSYTHLTLPTSDLV